MLDNCSKLRYHPERDRAHPFQLEETLTDEFDPTLGGSEQPAPEPAPEMPSDDEMNFISEAGIDPASIVTINANGGAPRFVPVSEPTPFATILQAAGLTFNGALDIYMNGQRVDMNTPIPGGSTVTVVGNVKGGAR